MRFFRDSFHQPYKVCLLVPFDFVLVNLIVPCGARELISAGKARSDSRLHVV